MKEYLGDSVYVDRARYGIRLTTGNGVGVTNEIVLEPETYLALLD
jgi:hypothetical protein